MRLRTQNQLPEVLASKMRQSIGYLIVNTRHMLSRKGETVLSGSETQAVQ